MPKENQFDDLSEIEEFLEEKIGLENIPENILEDIRLNFRVKQLTIFSLDKILEYSNFFRPFNIPIDKFASFFKQTGSSWRSKLTRGGWKWDKEKKCYCLEGASPNIAEKVDQSDVLSNDNTSDNKCYQYEFFNSNLSSLSSEELIKKIQNLTKTVNDLKQKMNNVDEVLKIKRKGSNSFEMTHLEDFQQVINPQQGELLIDIQHLEAIRLRSFCAYLFRRAVKKVGNTRKNIVSELFYRFSLTILSEKEIEETLYEEFSIEEFIDELE